MPDSRQVTQADAVAQGIQWVPADAPAPLQPDSRKRRLVSVWAKGLTEKALRPLFSSEISSLGSVLPTSSPLSQDPEHTTVPVAVPACVQPEFVLLAALEHQFGSRCSFGLAGLRLKPRASCTRFGTVSDLVTLAIWVPQGLASLMARLCTDVDDSP